MRKGVKACAHSACLMLLMNGPKILAERETPGDRRDVPRFSPPTLERFRCHMRKMSRHPIPTKFRSVNLRKWLDSHAWLWSTFLIMLLSGETLGNLFSPTTPLALPTLSCSHNTVIFPALRY